MCNLNAVKTGGTFNGMWGTCLTSTESGECAGVTDVWGTKIYTAATGGTCTAGKLLYFCDF